MTEEGAEADLLKGGRKQSMRERFRDRLLKKTDKSDKAKAKGPEQDDDLDDFLNPTPEGDNPSIPRKPVPRINVPSSTPWPEAKDVIARERAGYRGKGQQELRPSLPPRSRRREGLKVRFAETAPQIVGEGGDEAEAPTIWISQTRRSQSARDSAFDGHSKTQEASDGTVSFEASSAGKGPAGESFTPWALARAPTDLGDAISRQDAVATAKRMKDAEFELTLASGDIAQPAVQSDSGLRPSSPAGLERRMREEEARALTSGVRDASPEPSFQPQNMTPPASSQKHFPTSLGATDTQGRHSRNNSSTHLSPGQSPSPSRPSSLSSQGSRSVQSDSEQLSGLGQGSDHAGLRNAKSTKRKPLPGYPAPESKEDALMEFKSQARRYHGLFALAAEKTKLGLDPSLSQLIRAAAWWFLTAETNFKLLRKDLDEGANVLHLTASRRHMQAVVDLAKTAWIIEDKVQEYVTTESTDLSTPESIDRLIQENPLSRLSRTLGYRQDLSKRLGSLVAAVRRSGFMTSASENVPLSAGTDTSIWLTYHSPDARTADWFRSAHPAWIRMDDTVTPAEPFDLAQIVPLKSTADTFRIKSMFCQTSGGFQTHQRTPNVPCILTIGRRSGSYALVLFVASQDHGINVVVETDPVRGDGIDWQQTIFSALFNFADGFGFLIQLQQPDYFLLKDYYDLAMRASSGKAREAQKNKNMGERLIFRATSRTFERKASQQIKSFPYQGEQKDCEIVLLEKYELLKWASTPRRAHRGYKLSVILSPYASKLAILDVHLGGDKPILLHSAHEKNPPPIELLDIDHASLLIQFPRNRDFNRFYQFLTSLDHSAKEDHSVENMTLRSFSIEPSSSEAKSFLTGSPWRNVQITKAKARSRQQDQITEMVAPTNINICAFSNYGVFANRLSEGPSHRSTLHSLYPPFFLHTKFPLQADPKSSSTSKPIPATPHP